MATDDDLLKDAREAFEHCSDAEDHNRVTALEDLRFSRLGEQWPEKIIAERQADGRPCLTINKMPAFIRQVVNDARQNKPSIKVHPVDSGADVETAKIIDGLIRNIEYTSNADVAYDTAVEQAVSMGFGYFRIGLDYAYDDSFDLDIRIDRIANAFSVYGDPHSTRADSSDWNVAFITDRLPKKQYEKDYKGKATVDFNADAWTDCDETWLNEDGVLVAEWWTREQVEKEMVRLADGRAFTLEQLETDPDLEEVRVGIAVGMVEVTGSRKVRSHKVTQTIVSGADVLERRDWPGCYIPIVPVYGDEFDVQGKRYLRSLIYNAKDAQRMFNYWRTNSTELVALAPRVPFIGEEGTFDADPNWSTANSRSHPYLEYTKAKTPPARQPLDMGVAAGSIQEALNASDDIKAIIGLHDASLGARSNETSGRAIMARQREGDVSTFHFMDNMARAIRHAGRILIDLIPKVYDSERVIRIIGEDGSERPVTVNGPTPEMDDNGEPAVDEQGNAIMAMHDLRTGKYDLTVTTGPSFTTRREEAAFQMTELVRAFPQAAPLIADIMARNFDWPGADEIADRLKKLAPGQQEIPPEVQQAIEQGQQLIQQLQAENEQLKQGREIEAAKIEETRRANMADEEIDGFNAQTNRMKVGLDTQFKAIQAARPTPPPRSAR